MTRGRAAWLVLILAGLTLTGSPAAYADDVDKTTPAEAVEAIVDAAPAVLQDAAVVTTTPNATDVIATTVADTAISVPKDPASGIVVDPAAGPTIEIGLPSAKLADDAKPLSTGAVVYDNNDGSATVPVVKTDGSVSINTTIAGPDAPTVYRYPITVPDGGMLRLNDDGSVSVVDVNGSYTSGFSPAWAKDATGMAVGTHYELDGNTLIQVVDHTTSGVTYPVVADPWFGFATIDHVHWSGGTLEVYPTWWGRHTGVAARWAAWGEVVKKAPSANHDNMRDQFFCHWDVVRLVAPNKASWNLDNWRPNVGYWATVRANCNPQ
jgi:hypothetical protein